jgi:hypothetical protein
MAAFITASKKGFSLSSLISLSCGVASPIVHAVASRDYEKSADKRRTKAAPRRAGEGRRSITRRY